MGRVLAALVVISAACSPLGAEKTGLGEDAFSGWEPDPPLSGLGDPDGSQDPCDGFGNGVGGGVDEGCYCFEGEQQACFPGHPSLLDAGGICKAGVQYCVDVRTEFKVGHWSACESFVMPSEELCGNDIDENCDGVAAACGGGGPVDPSCEPGETMSCYPGPAETVGVGSCQAGERTCSSDGRWGSCQGAVVPSQELCDNDIDEDCSGEDLPCDKG